MATAGEDLKTKSTARKFSPSGTHKTDRRSIKRTADIMQSAGFIQVTKIPRTQTTIPTDIKTQNRFEVLSEDDEENEINVMDDQDSSTNTTNNKQGKSANISHSKPKPPPIKISEETRPTDFKDFHNKITDTTKEGCTISYGSPITIRTKCEEDHNRVQELLLMNNFEYHTHPLKHQVTKKIVIKAAPFSVPEEIIKLYGNHNVKILKCTKLKGKNDITTSFLLEVPREVDLNDIKKIKVIDNTIIRCQSYIKRNNIAQCRRCQDFGHGTTYCHKTPRCVKCGKDHLTNTCKKTRDSPATCANCQGPHPANFRGCLSYLEYLSTLEQRRNSKGRLNHNSSNPTRNIPQKPNTFLPSLYIHNKSSNATQPIPLQNINTQSANKLQPLTYSQALIRSPPGLNKYNQLEKALDKLESLCNLDQMIHMLNDINNALENVTDPFEQALVIAGIRNQYRQRNGP